MSNKKLIERLRDAAALPTGLYAEAADALEAADKRIAELTESLERVCIDAREQRNRRREAERKLAVAREALESCSPGDYTTGHVIHPSFDEALVSKALAQIGEK